MAPLRGLAAVNAEKAYCLNGHPLSGANLRLTARGWRVCRECARADHREWKMRNGMTVTGRPRPKPNFTPPTSETERSYLAGLLDGEGNISIEVSRGHRHALVIGIANTSLVLMEWLTTHGGVAYSQGRKSTRPNGVHWKPCFTWKLCGKNAEAFLRCVEPYLVIKSAQARTALEFRALGSHSRSGDKATARERYRSLSEQREELRQRMRSLNQRGVA